MSRLALSLLVATVVLGPKAVPASVVPPPQHCADTKSPKKLVVMEVRDVVPIAEGQNHAVMLVSKDGTVLPLFVTEESAVAIAFRLAHRHTPHPLAADLSDSLVNQLGAEVTEVRIDDIREHIFYGHVILRQGDKRVSIDARPSDAIALALTGNARIVATQKVLDEGGVTKQEIERQQSQPSFPDTPGMIAPPTPDGGISL